MLQLSLPLILLLCAGQNDGQEIRRGLNSEQIVSYVGTLTARHRIISDLIVSVGGGQILFDIETDSNPDDAPWLSVFNVTEGKFRQAERTYSAQGYRLAIHESATIRRRTFHSAVWFQESAELPGMEIPDVPLPEAGATEKSLAPLNELMRSFLKENHLPGATLAASRDGRMVYARGFGFADLDAREPMVPESMMRIASISKPITAVAVLRLVQDGRLQLNDLALDWIRKLDGIPEAESPGDARWQQITIRDLLDHTGGWDRDVTPDPMFRGSLIQSALRLSQPPASIDYVRYQLTQRLDFDPGTRTAYSNFGYCLLGRIIEAVTGDSYNDYVATSLLSPAGMQQTFPGRTRADQRRKGEVVYHTQLLDSRTPFWQGATTRRQRGIPELVTRPYGHWDLECMDAHGGWISSAPDLLRFLRQLEADSDPLIGRESRQLMLQPPTFADPWVWYSCGWNVRPSANGDHTYWHTGRLAGTSSLLVRRQDGWSWAILFHCDSCADGENAAMKIDPLVHTAIARITDVPAWDLFEENGKLALSPTSERNENRNNVP